MAKLGVGHLMLTARRVDRLDDLGSRLVTEFPDLKVETISADLSDPSVVTGLIEN